jgi:hypothetical protein
MTPGSGPPQWLLLIHQLPAHPAYQRVKLHRRLQAVGAVTVKKTVHALPRSDDALEDFLWTAKEIEAGGGEAIVCEAQLVHGVTDAQLRQQFDSARDAEYGALARDVRAALPGPRAKGRAPDAAESVTRAGIARLCRRLAEIVALDFFGANGRAAAESALAELEAHMMRSEKRESKVPAPAARALKDLRGKTWVTRRNVHVDRIACAWFIRRFIDAAARFKFVEPAGYTAARNELRFDMAEAEFTHRGDRCSFEVLLAESGLREPALQVIAEIVHDLDLKDGKFGRAETEGVRQLLSGITLSSESDKSRLERGATLFEDLYRSLQRSPSRRRKRA